jgi:hypothetical protein
MTQLLCEQVTQGLRDSERTVAVRDVHGRRHFLRVELGFLTREGERYWLPVGTVHTDRERGLTLVELPQEAETGANRLWVRSADLLESVRVPA